MKLSCLQENLKKGLATVSRAVAGKSPLPVLANILLATDGNRLKLAATDLEIGITCWIDAKVEEEGTITVPSRLFNDIIGNLPNDTVSLTLDARTQTLKIECSRFTSNVKGIEADEFPPIPTVADNNPTLYVPPDVLRQSVEQVAFAASGDESRPVLTGVLVRIHADTGSGGATMTMAAADGYRLATRTIKRPEDALPSAPEFNEFIIPARAMAELVRPIAEATEPVSITITKGGGQVLFHTQNADLVSRLIDGKFPDFERIIPSEYATRSVIDTQELVKAVKLASLFATSNQNFVKLSIEPGGDVEPGKIIINANAAELGDNTGTLDGIVHGEGGQIAMNVKYLTEALNVMGTSQVALETQGTQNPGVFKPVGQEEYVHVIMPMTMR
jgi:DNA polymerase-3 subunit beta